MKHALQRAFTLAEVMIMLLMTLLILIATMPLITVKHIKLPERAPHGKWACKLINNQMYSASASNVNSKLPPDSKWVKGCKFPKLPDSVRFIMVQVIGGGASGREGSLDISMVNKTEDLFPSEKNNSVYTVKETGKYKIYFPGEEGKKGFVTPSYFDVILHGFKYMSCSYPSANPNSNVPAVTFEYELERGDKLVLNLDKSGTQNNYNNKGLHLCDTSKPVMAEWVDATGNYHKEQYLFQSIQHSPGQNGSTRTLVLKRDSSKDLVQIKGSGGGYYASSTDSCNIDCSRRYLENFDRAEWNIEKFITVGSNLPYGVSKAFSSNKTAKITSSGHTAAYYGGCGGAAGQANTVIIKKPKESDFTIKIGKGGVNGSDGEDTIFDYIVAAGGTGCADKGVNTTLNGTDGEKANTVSETDSSGGKGGKGKIGAPIPSDEEMKGKDAFGFGAGGGGGAIALNISKPIEYYLNETYIHMLEDLKIIAKPGSGASGGVIVSW